MSVLSATFDFQRLQDEEVAWKLLRAHHAPMIIAILDAHLGGSVRRLASEELEHLVDVDMDELRRADLELRRPAKTYCDNWREDGYLVRRPLSQARGETYELSTGALAAIAFAKQLVQPRRTATQSRLANITTQIHTLALAINRDDERRRKALMEERERIDARLKELEQGTYRELDTVQALEQVQEIVNLAQEIPRDFARVRDDFERINSTLYATIINYEEGHRDVLQDIFSGVDQISGSPSGRSFKGFYSLLRDVELAEILQDDIDAILDDDATHELSIADRQFLRNLLREFREQGQEVNSVMTSFAQGLRRFVQNQDYQQDRMLKRLIDQSLGKASTLLEAYSTTTKLGITLDLTSVHLRSVSRYTLLNPFETRADGVEVPAFDEAEPLSLEELKALARETEIDFSELTENVNLSLRKEVGAGREGITVAQVLKAYPATQGVASVVGLMVLALEQGRISNEREVVGWRTEQGEERLARIARFEFYREVVL